MVFQPKVDIVSGKIVSFEALMLWTSASLGVAPPAQFIPVAEATGLNLQIGAWAMQQACRQAAAWASRFDRPVHVAVNLSMRQFHQRDLIGMIRKSMASGTAQAVAFELEITESIVMSLPDEVDDLLQQIRKLGVTLSIDDFGTGYSSLAYLKRFPVQYLKIDRAFMRDLGADLNSAAIIESIVSLAHGLNLRVVAEGVETAGQLRLLQTVGCDEYQGYLFSKPLRADDATALLLENWAEVASDRNA
jgi:EAL domain-containing protein (putative c-di-GMP-specific phosphodiesterase class I)